MEWYRSQAADLKSSSSSKERAIEVLGTRYSIFDEKQTIAVLKQFAGVEKANISGKVKYSFFYGIDPDNTLIICFDDENKVTEVYFGGQ